MKRKYTPQGPIHGTVKLSKDGKILTITTQAKRGTKMVDNVQNYLVEDSCPDVRVASPAFKLTKVIIVARASDMSAEALDSGASAEIQLTGKVYHVGFNEWGPFCDCAHATFRGSNSMAVCKHCLAIKTVLSLLLAIKDHADETS